MKTCAVLRLTLLLLLVSPEFSNAGDGGPATASGSKAYGKRVFGYLTFGDTKWTSSSYGSLPVDSLPWDVLTHAVLFAAGGSAPIPSSYANQLPHLTAKAHQWGVYAGLCYGGSSDEGIVGVVNNSALWPAWLTYNLGLIDNGLDFLEFDFENTVNVTAVRGLFQVLYDSLQTRRSANNPSVPPFIVLTVGPSRAASWVSLEPYVGHVNLMSYDYIGDWWGRIIHDFSPKSYANWNGTGTNLDYYAPVGSTNAPAPSMQQAAIRVRNAGWPLDKIVVGFDANPTYWYGGSFSDGRGPTYIRKPTSGNTQTMSSNLDFNTQWPTLSQIHPDSIHFDQIAQTYWAHTGTSAADDKVWVMGALPGRDSAVWATRKVVDSMNIGGVMFWNLGGEIWNTSSVPPGGKGWFFHQIRKHFGGSSTPPPPADTIAPSIGLTAPAAGDTVSGTVSLTAQASDNVGVVSVRFHVNGAQQGTAVASPPYTRSWNTSALPNGQYTIRATASDAAGLAASDSAVVVVYNPPPFPGDSIPPAVTVTAPSAGDTVSGSVQVSAAASDASGIREVRLLVDGTATGTVDVTAPYTLSWSSGGVSDGSHTLGVRATDSAGLTSSAVVQVNVRNTLPPPPPDSGALDVYGDGLAYPWVNASWSSVNTFTSTEQVYEGSYAFKTQQNAWGAFSVHSGSWSAPVTLNTAGYDSLRFAVYPESTALSLSVFLENDALGPFGSVVTSAIPPGQWTVISIPIGSLNPGNIGVHRLNIQNNTAQSRTYHLDRVEFTGAAASGVTPLAIPSLQVPPNGAVDQAVDAQLSWASVTGATSYDVQVALDQLFSVIVTAVQTPTAEATVGPLANGTSYFWRVRATASGNQSAFSSAFSFATLAGTQALKYNRLFVDFGKVPVGGEKTDSVVIQNNGSAQRRIVGISSSSSAFSAEAGGLYIPAGGSQKVFIKYKPTKKTSDNSRVISIIDSTNSVDTVRVVGSGVNAPRQRNRPRIVIGDISPEDEGSGDLVVGNEGDLDLEILSVVSTEPGISVYPSAATVAPHDSVSFTVTVDGRGKSGKKVSGYLLFQNNGFDPVDSVLVEATVTGSGGQSGVPVEFSIAQNYPNPFNPSTTIEFGLPVESRVTVRIYNVIGQVVRDLYDGTADAGYVSVVWDGLTDRGQGLAGGVYFYHIEAFAADGSERTFVSTRRMMFVK